MALLILPLTAFISHMVQMKGGRNRITEYYRITFISHMVQMKGEKELLDALENILYIPHGSDERRQATLFHPNRRSLYPTWFR